MNKIINKFLLTGDKLLPYLHFKQPGFTYIACELFNKHCERIQKFREMRNLKLLYRNELDETCFAHDAAYSKKKDVANRTISDKIFKDRAHEISRN